MKQFATTIVLIATIAQRPAFGETFKKSKVIDNQGKEQPAEMEFDSEQKRLKVSARKTLLAEIPYAAIDKLEYEMAARRRVKEGAVVMIASLGIGAVVMLTKSKNHWLYVNYKPSDKQMTLKLDKGEYERILKVAAAQTGKTIVKLSPGTPQKK